MKFKSKKFNVKIGKVGYNFIKDSQGGLVKNVTRPKTLRRR